MIISIISSGGGGGSGSSGSSGGSGSGSITITITIATINNYYRLQAGCGFRLHFCLARGFGREGSRGLAPQSYQQ